MTSVGSNAAAEACDVLAAALEQMDGIIAGSRVEPSPSSKRRQHNQHIIQPLSDSLNHTNLNSNNNHKENGTVYMRGRCNSASSGSPAHNASKPPIHQHYNGRSSSVHASPRPHHKKSRRLQHARTLRLLEDLRDILELCDNKKKVLENIPSDILGYIRHWLVDDDSPPSSMAGMYLLTAAVCTEFSRSFAFCMLVQPSHSLITLEVPVISLQDNNAGDQEQQLWNSVGESDMTTDYISHETQSGPLTPECVEEKLHRLEKDKENLTLHVGVLTDQVEVQGNKISDLEDALDEKHSRLDNTEKRLSKELLTRTSLETHKLDLMAEISSLKIKLAASEKDKRELEDRLKHSQRRIADLETWLNIRDAELKDMRQRMAKNGLNGPDDTSPTATINSLGDSFRERSVEKERTLERLKRKQSEVEKLKKAVDSLMAANVEKDKRLDDMRKNLKRYKRVEEMVVQAQGKKALDDLLALDDDTSSNGSTTPSLSNDVGYSTSHSTNTDHKVNNNTMTPYATSTPVTSTANDSLQLNQNNLHRYGSPFSAINGSTPKKPSVMRSSSCEEIIPNQPKTPPSSKRNLVHNSSYGTLPNRRTNDDSEHRKTRPFHTLGKTILKIKSNKRSCSAPNLGQAHQVNLTDDPSIRPTGNTMPGEKKKRGLRKLFGRLKRSSSQDLTDKEQPPEEFKRGGIRATAVARLGWSRDIHSKDDLTVPFAHWDCDRVTVWLHQIGLNMYLTECKRWVKNGDQLLRASTHDLEKELCIRNPLHKKKLQLALQAIGSDTPDKLAHLDHNWATRWLDDIGLPQYKDCFYDGRIDGRMLHYMTVEDLLALKVSNELHHMSIKRGIQVLRMNNFSPDCLRRRPLPDELDIQKLQNVPKDVILWTNHRVMEWLRTIDLSEYAPNLRGSGVHGALMVLEPRFNTELFCQLLMIPSHKTLLRRHLNTHFLTLLGKDIQKRKRDYEITPGFSPLSVNGKVRLKKFGLFSHKRSKSESEYDGFICPMEGGAPAENGHMSNGVMGKPPLRQKGQKDEKAAKEIGAYSKEINSLTSMLTQERLYATVPSSNV